MFWEAIVNRRSLLLGLGLAGVGATDGLRLVSGFGSALAQSAAQMTDGSGGWGGAEEYPWGSPVVNMHFHCRKTSEAAFQHLNGCGETMAVLLTRAPADVEVANQTIGKYLGRFYLFTSAAAMDPDAVEILKRCGVAGTKGFGEFLSVNVAIDGPWFERIYNLAAEMDMPVLTHYQDYDYSPHPSNPLGLEVLKPVTGLNRPQFPRLQAVIRAHPNTTFIGHGPSFWANISADPGAEGYPSGPVRPGGLSDKMLSDFPNLYGGLDATSGINALHRDPEFAKDFLTRHQDKLLYGSDCSCIDGRGAGRNAGGEVAVEENSLQSLVSGNCLSRVQLTQLKQLSSPEVFRKITWENGKKLLKLSV